jgi:hypothetical protein
MSHERVITPAAEFLADAGKFLYGRDGWLGPFAADLDVKPAMLQNWLKGKSKLRGDHPVLKRALGLIEGRLEQQRDGWRARVDELDDAAMPDAPSNDNAGASISREIVASAAQKLHEVGAPVVRRHK